MHSSPARKIGDTGIDNRCPCPALTLWEYLPNVVFMTTVFSNVRKLVAHEQLLVILKQRIRDTRRVSSG